MSVLNEHIIHTTTIPGLNPAIESQDITGIEHESFSKQMNLLREEVRKRLAVRQYFLINFNFGF